MPFRVELNTDLEELNEIWEKEEGESVSTTAFLIGKFFGAMSRIAVYGFLLARPGVPFLPHGNARAATLTLFAALAVSLPLHKWRREYLVFAAALVIAIWFIVLTMSGKTTSIVLAGTIVTALSQAADSYPFVYGVIFGGAIAAIAVQVFNITPFVHSQLLLSHEKWTPDRAGHQGLLLVAMLLLTALIHLGHQETKRVREKMKAAEAARDAAVADERARIARELHDVVSHHVTAMTLQAEAAAMTGDKAALASVATAGRDALTELRRMLGVLRRPDSDAPGELDPQPDLDQLDALAARTSSGPRVTVERRGNVRSLSAGLELGVFRLVQEALTNTSKHSDATAVDVVLTYGDTDLTVEVLDNGRPLVAARVGSGGLGLVGMQERIALLDGELTTGPRADTNGFRVFARLPIEQ